MEVVVVRVEDDCRVKESDEKSRAVSSTGNNLVGSLASLSVVNAAASSPREEECGSGRSSSGGDCSSKEEQAPSVKQNLNALRSKRDSSRGGGGGGGKKENDTTGYMDGALWGELPEHLHDIILAWLPLPSFFHLRCVCKRWNNIIESRSFLSICSRVPSHGPFFLMFADPFRQKIAAYDPTLHRWHLLPLSFFLSCPFFESFIVLAAAGGLLCVGGAGSQCRSLFVSNPMTRSQRKLPPMIDMKSPYVVGMVMNPQHDSYQILVAQDGEHLMSQVYDSKSNTWKMTHGLEKRVALIAGTAYINGFLYSMTYGATTGVLAYNVDQGQWHEVRVKMPLSLVCPQLLGHRGQLMMVGGVEEFGTLKSVHLWRLEIPGKEWIEVQQMPESLFNKLFKSQGHHFLCVSHGDYICFTDYYSREMLMYDIYRNSWWWLPVCILSEYMEARSALGFSFEPRLDAMV
ncbi:hypothetical protein CY35_08G118300 [Sphagnum magellanicum]|nr:hypothetical protein CY35_08G118300 [Sphagnum magellanicum]